MVLFKAVYFYNFKPYDDLLASKIESVNILILLVTLNFQPCVSAWITDTDIRFKNGIYYDVIFGLGMILNLLIVIAVSIQTMKLKIIKFMIRRRY